MLASPLSLIFLPLEWFSTIFVRFPFLRKYFSLVPLPGGNETYFPPFPPLSLGLGKLFSVNSVLIPPPLSKIGELTRYFAFTDTFNFALASLALTADQFFFFPSF